MPNKPIRTWVRLDVESVEKLDHYCSGRNMSRSRAMREAIQEWLDNLPSDGLAGAESERKYDRSRYMVRKMTDGKTEQVARSVRRLAEQIAELPDEEAEKILRSAIGEVPTGAAAIRALSEAAA